MTVRRLLDRLYNAAVYAAAFFMVATLAMILLGVAGRELGFFLKGSDAYAGYCMAAAAFLALAHTLKRGEHIRVTLVLQHVGTAAQRGLEIFCHLAATVISGLLAFYSARLVWQSYAFNDISQANDATPLWLPQIGMAVGAVLLFVALLDDLLLLLTRGRGNRAATDEPARLE